MKIIPVLSAATPRGKIRITKGMKVSEERSEKSESSTYSRKV